MCDSGACTGRNPTVGEVLWEGAAQMNVPILCLIISGEGQIKAKKLLARYAIVSPEAFW